MTYELERPTIERSVDEVLMLLDALALILVAHAKGDATHLDQMLTVATHDLYEMASEHAGGNGTTEV